MISTEFELFIGKRLLGRASKDTLSDAFMLLDRIKHREALSAEKEIASARVIDQSVALIKDLMQAE